MSAPESNSTFDGTFEDEESSGSEVSSSGEEDSVEEDSEEEVPMSKSEIPFDKKVKMFDSGGKLKSSSESDENFDDESGSESGSEYSGEEDYSEEGSSGSEESSHGDKDGQESFLNEQERLRGMGSISSNNSRKWYFIGLGICCVVILALSIGLGVGLTRNKDEEPEDGAPAPASIPTFAPGMQPTNAPVRMSIKLPSFRLDVVTDGGVLDVESDKATTIYRDGPLSETTNEQENSLNAVLVQGGDPDNAELPSAFALIEFPVTSDEVSYALSPMANKVTLSLNRVSDVPNPTVTYSACLIEGGPPTEGVDTLTGLNATYSMPNDCTGQNVVNFDVSPTDTAVSVDVSNMVFVVFDSFNDRQALRNLRGHRILEEPSTETLLMMIDTGPSNQTGDRFSEPHLKIEGILGCKSVFDVICSDEQFSSLCTMATAAQGVEEYLSYSDITFFAPTNDAIEKFLATGIDIDPYFYLDHLVFSSQIKSSDIDCSLSELPPLQMAEGITTVTCDSGSIFIAGGGNTGDLMPKIVDADIQSCNAIIHAIDNVILPILDDESGDESGDEDS